VIFDDDLPDAVFDLLAYGRGLIGHREPDIRSLRREWRGKATVHYHRWHSAGEPLVSLMLEAVPGTGRKSKRSNPAIAAHFVAVGIPRICLHSAYTYLPTPQKKTGLRP
jgi:hypothetical protein